MRFMDVHHEIGPSVHNRRFRCPGSRRLERGLHQPQDDSAEVGTRLHEKVALSFDGDEYESDPDEKELIDRCQAFISRTLPAHPEELYKERRLSLESTVHHGKVISFGTADVVAVYADHVVVVDWKFHNQPPEQDDCHFQLRDYLAMACCEFKKHRGEGWVYAPRLELTYHTELAHQADISVAIQDILNVENTTQLDDAPLRAGKHCNYCRAKAVCPAVRDGIKGVVRDLVPAGGEQPKTKKALETELRKRALQLPQERLIEMAQMLPFIEPAVPAIRAAVRESLALDPDSIPGWELRETNGNRSADKWELYNRLCLDSTVHALTEDEFLECGEFSVAALEKAYTAARIKHDGRIKKGEAEKEFKSVTAGIVSQPKITKLQRVK